MPAETRRGCPTYPATTLPTSMRVRACNGFLLVVSSMSNKIFVDWIHL